MANQRQAEESGVRQDARDDAGVIQTQIGEARILVGPGRIIDDGSGAKPAGEATQFRGGDGSPSKVHVVNDDAPLAKEPLRCAGGRGVVASEHLDVGHLPGRGLGERCRHVSAPGAWIVWSWFEA